MSAADENKLLMTPDDMLLYAVRKNKKTKNQAGSPLGADSVCLMLKHDEQKCTDDQLLLRYGTTHMSTDLKKTLLCSRGPGI